MQDIDSVYAWQESLELAKELIGVCEEFSDGDKNVLVGHLRQAVIEIPSTIAADIKLGRSATMEPAIRLATELELVHRIYPAIDTDGVPARLAALMERMESDKFAEREPVGESTEESTEESIEAEAGVAATVQPPAKSEPASSNPYKARVLHITNDDTPAGDNQTSPNS